MNFQAIHVQTKNEIRVDPLAQKTPLYHVMQNLKKILPTVVVKVCSPICFLINSI